MLGPHCGLAVGASMTSDALRLIPPAGLAEPSTNALHGTPCAESIATGVHYLGQGAMFTACGLPADRDAADPAMARPRAPRTFTRSLAVSIEDRQVTCAGCRVALT